MAKLSSGLLAFLRFLQRILIAIAGRWRWEAPRWARATGGRSAAAARYVAASRTRLLTVIFVLATGGSGLAWWVTRPKPHYVSYMVEEPGLTEYNQDGISKILPLTVIFDESAAPLAQIEKAVTSGIKISPAISGTWFWTTDRNLRFTPKDDWPVGTAFSVTLARTAVARQVRLEKYVFPFRSQPFSARIAGSEFYQDPRDPKLKKLVATVAFSHPVDTARFESHVSLIAAKDAEYLGLTGDSRFFTVVYDKFKLNAHIHSAPLTMPRDDTTVTVRIDKGVRAARGGNDSPDRLEVPVVIPGRTSLRFSNARMIVADNARHEPEQVLLLQSSSPVAERPLSDKISAWILPVRHPRQPTDDPRPYNWRGEENEIGNDILALATRLPLEYVPSDDAGNTSHGFKFRAPVGRYVYAVVKDGVDGIGGYISGKPFVSTVEVEPYPAALTFLGEGALLSESGDHKVGFLVRDVDAVRVEIGRVLPNQLPHLVPQMWSFSRPSIYPGLEDRLVERFATVRDYSQVPPGRPTYDSIDVGQYLRDRTQTRRGLFLVHVTAVDRSQLNNPDPDAVRVSRRGERIEDVRLVLVTDLGFIVKRDSDNSRDVFVLSIATGQPMAGARVTLAGANGLAVLASTTDANGHAALAAPPRAAIREKTPDFISVETDSDMSFMPLRTRDRDLEISRFDIGGVINARSTQQVSTYLFSDRGIYRPGETTHLGIITRMADWKSSLAGLPIDVDITDARGMLVSRQQVAISADAFDEIAYTTAATAPTGTYEANAYLTKPDKRRERLGGTTFRVQEFEPDRMKVQLQLSSDAVAGWLKPGDVDARVTVAHLFGEPASQRRVEGELSLTLALPRFSKFDDYRFQIGEVIKEPYHEVLAALTTDDRGSAAFALDLKRFAGRAYRLSILARAFEAEGGRNVAAQNAVIVSDAPYLVGVKPDGDLTYVRRTSARTVRWLAVDPQLNPVAAHALTLEWVEQKYVSVLTQQDNGTMKYVSRLKDVVRSSQPAAISAGGTSLPLPTDEPGDFVLVLRDSGGAELNRVSYRVAGQANLTRSLDRNAELQVQLDKPAYGAGDTIEVSIRAPYAGAGLITIERERVFQFQWFKTTTTSSVQRIAVPADFEGNGYVSVQFVRDPASDELFMSPLSFGVAPFAANLASRRQAVALETPKTVKPGAVMSIKVAPGEPSKVAVLAVDDGILQVARYKNPDPLEYFFQKRMLEVETSQILDLILPDFKRFVALAAAGGDADGGFARQLNPFNKKRKPAVAFWSGVVSVGTDGRELTYTVPDYFNGRLRIVAVSASGQRVGVAESSTEVKGDFILTPNVPATVGPGDEFVVSVGVFNNTTGGTGPVRITATPGPGAALVSSGAVDTAIADLKEGVAEFRLKAQSVLGPTSLTFSARRGAAEARVEESLGIRPASAFRTQLTLGRVDAATTSSPLTRDLYPEKRTVEAAISTLPMVWGQGLIAYLDHYEYSCTEQLVSKGLSALVVISRPEFGVIKNRPDSPLDETYATLRARLNEQGGLGLWTSSPETAEFPTAYAAHFLIEANERGQKIPQDVLASVNNWLMRLAATPAPTLSAARLRAYAVYLLTRQGIRATAGLTNVEQELTKRYPKVWQSDLAAAYLAATYKLMQKGPDADRIIAAVPWATAQADADDSVYYGGTVHDAQLLYLVAKHFPERLRATPPPALETISKAVSGSRASSLAAAYTILALDAYARTASATATLGIAEIGKDGNARALALPDGAIPKVAVASTAAQLRFSKAGSLPAYFVINESGFDRNPPATEISHGVEIVREFLDAKGNPVTRVKVGEEFFVRLRIRATDRDRVPQVAVVDVLPGGVEPVLELQPAADSSAPGEDPAMARQSGRANALPIGVPGRSTWTPDHIDVREDRIVLYGEAGRDAGTFVYRVRANSAGLYQVPPVFAEGMYNRTIAGQGRASTLEVIKP